MARQSIDLPLAERIGAYWQACQTLHRERRDHWQYWRAQRVIVVLARCEATYRLRTAARRVWAEMSTEVTRPSQPDCAGSPAALPTPEAPDDLAS